MNPFQGTCFKLKNGKLMGIVMSEELFFTGHGYVASLVILLKEKEKDKVSMEIFSYATRLRDKNHKKHVKSILELLKTYKFQYEILKEFNDFFSQYNLSDFDKLILDQGRLLSAKRQLENFELEKKRIKEREPFRDLPTEIKFSAPCPLLETSEFSDIFICGASKYTYVPHSSLSKKETINQCTENRYMNCKYYIETLDKIRTCPFLKSQATLLGDYIYTCKASKHVHVPFSRISRKQFTKHCIKDRYYDCEYYLNALNTIENKIKEIEEKIENNEINQQKLLE